MNRIIVIVGMISVLFSCQQPESDTAVTSISPQFDQFLENYYVNRLGLFPLEATFNGEEGYDDTLTIDISETERLRQRNFYAATLDSLTQFNYEKLNNNEKLSYDVLKRDLTMGIEGLQFHDNYTPINQFASLPLVMGQMGSGQSAQPFKTVEDYDNWLKRLDLFINWLDSSIIYFRKGMASDIVLPKAIVKKVIPQTEAMIVKDSTKSLFYDPIRQMPNSFDSSDKQRLQLAYGNMISKKLVPTYKKLRDFLKQEYLPQARTSSGIDSIPNGEAYYRYLIRYYTTTNKTPEEIYETGLQEVARIKAEMEKVKEQVGFKRDLPAFLRYLKTSRRFMPYKKPEEIIQAFQDIYDSIKPNLAKMFTEIPTTKFEIRQTEAFRAASASAEYNPGAPDGSRPGIFYIPITNARKFNVTGGMESLFLHEAIPGHHFQISLQQENKDLPKFRRFGGNNAYVEGWALYCESLGKELGLYKDPYQYMGALGDEMQRATRLVVDVAIHAKNMTREGAIKYMMENQAISLPDATAEIERYMVIPGQALSYKIGALKIRSLREKYEKELGKKFQLPEFHRQVLKDGPLPLDVLENKLDRWANEVKSSKR